MEMRPAFEGGLRCAVAALAAAALSCAPGEADLRPSVLLIVIDTLRADAVSAYGAVEGTTPNIDALARDGLLYTNASSPSPWTLPSHASLFTGVGVAAHGVGIHGRMALPDEHATLAEALTRAGYQTAGFAENPLVSEAFGLTRGFERFCALSVQEALEELVFQTGRSCDVVDVFGRFAGQDSSRPFFAFVNLYDAHAPYTIREENRFLPPEIPMFWDEQELATTPQRLCDALPAADDLKTLYGLYLGDVAAADEKVGKLVAQARRASGDRPLIVIVTSDHGELFGEQRLLDHEYTLSQAALRIPLVVSGLEAVPGSRIEAPVTLADLPASILEWLQIDARVGGGRALPTRADEAVAPRDLIAWYSDALHRTPAVFGEGVAGDPSVNDFKRSKCGDQDRVFGDMVSVTRWPHKLVWHQRYAPPEIYDLSWDERERSDRYGYQPPIAEPLTEAAKQWYETHVEGGAAPAAAPSQAELDALRGLGYLEPAPDATP